MQAHRWVQKYKLVDIGGQKTLLQLQQRETEDPSVTDNVWREVVNTETIFDALSTTHGHDHVKARSLFYRAELKYANLTMSLCKIFGSTCPQVISTLVLFRPMYCYLILLGFTIVCAENAPEKTCATRTPTHSNQRVWQVLISC